MSEITILSSVDLNIEASCRQCGHDLGKTIMSDSDSVHIEVEPCKKCMAVERKEGRSEGYEECMKDASVY